LIRDIAPLDEVLAAHRGELGADFTAYRNHAYRVVNLCAVLAPGAALSVEKIALAAAFHDLGIWTARTFDYLAPSAELACAHLAHAGKAEWSLEMSAMIYEHHKLTRYRGNDAWLVEPFRRADLIDVSHGIVSFGLPRAQLREIFAAWPDAGFHGKLVKLALERLATHPRSPLPMLKW
jgi:hypothetical protein